MLASGKLPYFTPNAPPTDPFVPLGAELSGLSGGRGKMGVCRFRGIGLQNKLDEYLQWDVPGNWTLEDAATVPVAYATVSFCLPFLLSSFIIQLIQYYNFERLIIIVFFLLRYETGIIVSYLNGSLNKNVFE